MTQEIGRQITSLRLKGLGYKSIALAVGITKESVRYYCKKNGLDGFIGSKKIIYEAPKNNPDICKFCGGMIERSPRSGKKLFCCEEHRRAWWKAHPEEARRGKEATYKCECSYCKRIFYSYGNKNRKYCSHDCYIQDRFWTDRATELDGNEIAIRQRVALSGPTEIRLKRIS